MMKSLTSIENLKSYLKREERKWTLAAVQAKKLNEQGLSNAYKLNAKALNRIYHQVFKED